MLDPAEQISRNSIKTVLNLFPHWQLPVAFVDWRLRCLIWSIKDESNRIIIISCSSNRKWNRSWQNFREENCKLLIFLQRYSPCWDRSGGVKCYGWIRQLCLCRNHVCAHFLCCAQNSFSNGKTKGLLHLPSPPYCFLHLCIHWMLCLPLAPSWCTIKPALGIYHMPPWFHLWWIHSFKAWETKKSKCSCSGCWVSAPSLKICYLVFLHKCGPFVSSDSSLESISCYHTEGIDCTHLSRTKHVEQFPVEFRMDFRCSPKENDLGIFQGSFDRFQSS